MKGLLILTFLGLVMGCGGSGGEVYSTLQRPSLLALNAKAVSHKGTPKQLIWVADEGLHTLSAFSVQDERFMQLLANDFVKRSALPIGGAPSALAVEERPEGLRVWVADQDKRHLLALELSSVADEDERDFAVSFVDLGTSPVGLVSRPLLVNAGRRSTPSLRQIELTDDAPCELWRVTSDKDKAYTVEGSVSGQEAEPAQENQSYVTADGRLSFIIESGADPTTAGDTLYFYSCVAKPLLLSAAPMAVFLSASYAHVFTNDPVTVLRIDLSQLTVESETVLGLSRLDSCVEQEAAVYCSDGDSGTLLQYHLSDASFSTSPISLPGSIPMATGVSNELILAKQQDLRLWDWQAQSELAQTSIWAYPTAGKPFLQNGQSYLALPTLEGFLELLDLNSFSRVDTWVRKGRNSYTRNVQFFDLAPASSPDLIAVNTQDGSTLSEAWQLVYEGFIPGFKDVEVEISSDTLTSLVHDFSYVQEGDRVLIGSEERQVVAVSDQAVLQLDALPLSQGLQIVSLRSSGNYVVWGSVSGLQRARVLENQAYVSDAGQISLSIRASFQAPVSEGDTFSFASFDGVEGIDLGIRGLAKDLIIVPSAQAAMAYVAHTAAGHIAVVDLLGQKLRKTIR